MMCLVLMGLAWESVSGQGAAVQDTAGPSMCSVSWVDQYPSADRNGISKKEKGRFSDFLFGKKNEAGLERPVSLLAADPGAIWILDQENGAIFRVKNKLGDFTQFGNKKIKTFPSLVGCCYLNEDQILVTDSYLNRIFLYTLDNHRIVVLNDSLILDRPTGIAYSKVSGEIWVVESNAHRISVLDMDGNLKRRIGQRGTGKGEFNYPTSVWIDAAGRVYVVDAMNFRIQVFDKEGTCISMFGRNGDGSGNFARPKGIATDSFGNIYVADALFNAVQVFDLSGKFLSVFGTQGHDKGEFWMPTGIFIDDQDNIYVADSYNSRIQVFHVSKGGRQ